MGHKMTDRQSSLFAAPEPPPEPASTTKAKKVCPHLSEPWGKPDAKGKRFYERFWASWQALNPADRDLLWTITNVPWERFEAVAKLVAEWRRAEQFDRDDFDQAVGR